MKHKISSQPIKNPLHKGHRRKGFIIKLALNQNVLYITGNLLRDFRGRISPFYVTKQIQ